MVFELQEAFNAVNSEIIFGIVDAIDLSAKIITWLKFYILDWTFQFYINNSCNHNRIPLMLE